MEKTKLCKECNRKLPKESRSTKMFCEKKCKTRYYNNVGKDSNYDKNKKYKIQQQVDFCKQFGLTSFTQKVKRSKEIIL